MDVYRYSCLYIGVCTYLFRFTYIRWFYSILSFIENSPPSGYRAIYCCHPDIYWCLYILLSLYFYLIISNYFKYHREFANIRIQGSLKFFFLLSKKVSSKKIGVPHFENSFQWVSFVSFLFPIACLIFRKIKKKHVVKSEILNVIQLFSL